MKFEEEKKLISAFRHFAKIRYFSTVRAFSALNRLRQHCSLKLDTFESRETENTSNPGQTCYVNQ